MQKGGITGWKIHGHDKYLLVHLRLEKEAKMLSQSPSTTTITTDIQKCSHQKRNSKGRFEKESTRYKSIT